MLTVVGRVIGISYFFNFGRFNFGSFVLNLGLFLQKKSRIKFGKIWVTTIFGESIWLVKKTTGHPFGRRGLRGFVRTCVWLGSP
jgi:hypothetical protein